MNVLLRVILSCLSCYIFVGGFGRISPHFLWAAHAQILSPEVEVRVITGVGFVPQTVTLRNTYTSPIPVCLHHVPSVAISTAIPRISNLGPTSFDLNVQAMPNINPGATYDVHCVIVDEGEHTLADGRRVQAFQQIVSDTLGNNAGGWDDTVDVSALVSSAFTNPVVLGAMISSNDARATAFHMDNCLARGPPPFDTGPDAGICIGYHVGEQTGLPTYAAEIAGVIIVEAGTGTVNDIRYEVQRSQRVVDGVGNDGAQVNLVTSPATEFDIGVATQAGEVGGQGGWAVAFRADPLPPDFFVLAIEEETVAGDTSRTHTVEFVDYWVFQDNSAPIVEAEKTVAAFDPLGEDLFQIPGSDVLYTITVRNSGTGLVDDDSIFLVDRLPAETVFFNGDVDDGGPLTGAVAFEDFGSGLNFDPATDLSFATGSTPPQSIADCTHSAVAGFDPSVRFLCLTPRGPFLPGDPDPGFSFTFRARVN